MQINRMMSKIFVGILFAAAMTACSKKEPEVPQLTAVQLAEAKLAEQKAKDEAAIKNTEVLESYRAISMANAETNARAYRDSNPRLEGMKIVNHPDLMMTAECLQGSGWIWISYMGEKKSDTKEVEKYKAYCSTNSQATGCFLDKDFRETAFAKELKQCNRGIKLPFKSFTGA